MTNQPDPNTQAAAFLAAHKQSVRQLFDFDRDPLTPDVIAQEIDKADWPKEVLVHPVDFFSLTALGMNVNRDNLGPYIYISSTKVRPKNLSDDVLDLSNYSESKITLAQFVGR